MFPGFPPEALTFLRSLGRNNRREWFQPRKEIFENKLKAPMIQLVEAINGPINVMGVAGMPAVAELERLGVARVSTASGPARVAMTATKKVAATLIRDGSFDMLGGDTMSHQEANTLMSRRG